MNQIQAMLSAINPDMLQCSLFAPHNFDDARPRQMFDDVEVIKSLELIISVHGVQLDRREATLYAYLLAVAIEQQTLNVTVAMAQLYELLGLPANAESQASVQEHLLRLRMLTLTARSPMCMVAGGLIKRFGYLEPEPGDRDCNLSISLGDDFSPVFQRQVQKENS